MATAPREHWSSRTGFVLAAVGSAVGLGNMWRFSYLTAENGGAAFVVLYLGFTLIVGLPVMLAELTQMAAREFAPTLRVNAVAPGPVIAPEDKDEHYLKGLIAALPVNRPGSPTDIADAVLYLAVAAAFVFVIVVFL